MRDVVPHNARHVEEKRLYEQEELHPLVVLKQRFIARLHTQHVEVIVLLDVEGALDPAVAVDVLLVAFELGGHPAVDRRAVESAKCDQNDEHEQDGGGVTVRHAIREEVYVAHGATRAKSKRTSRFEKLHFFLNKILND